MSDLLSGLSMSDAWMTVLTIAATLGIVYAVIYRMTSRNSDKVLTPPSSLRSFWLFFYSSFIKPHNRNSPAQGQQHALESFYKGQASVYDATRKKLLRGREDMLGLVAAQLKGRPGGETNGHSKRIWVDVGATSLFQMMEAGRVTAKSVCLAWRRYRLQHRNHVVKVRLCARLLFERVPCGSLSIPV